MLNRWCCCIAAPARRNGPWIQAVAWLAGPAVSRPLFSDIQSFGRKPNSEFQTYESSGALTAGPASHATAFIHGQTRAARHSPAQQSHAASPVWTRPVFCQAARAEMAGSRKHLPPVRQGRSRWHHRPALHSGLPCRLTSSARAAHACRVVHLGKASRCKPLALAMGPACT